MSGTAGLSGLFVDKLLTQLSSPLGLALGFLLVAALLALRGRHRASAALVLTGVTWMSAWSMPLVSDALRHSLEARYPEQAVATLPVVDAVVVLGGAMRPAISSGRQPNLGAAADRIWHAARLYHARCAPRVIVSGGKLPWHDVATTEAEAIGQFLRDLGVPADVILLEQNSRNTRENALYTAKLLNEHGIGRVLLVTSALHMRRALASFQLLGVDAVPAATDFEVNGQTRSLDWLPDAEALAASSRTLREYLGYVVYRWRGWV